MSQWWSHFEVAIKKTNFSVLLFFSCHRPGLTVNLIGGLYRVLHTPLDSIWLVLLSLFAARLKLAVAERTPVNTA